MAVDLMQLVYLLILIVLGSAILFLRRKARGSKSLYKLVLVLAGVLLSTLSFKGRPLFNFEPIFMADLSIFLLIVLLFELSTRLNPDNIQFSRQANMLFFGILLINLLVFSFLAIFLLKIGPVDAMIFALIISSVEYFMVNELKKEGDLANPFIILFSFLVLFFYNMSMSSEYVFLNFLQSLLIGLGAGVLAGIVVFKSMKNHKVTWFDEIVLVAAALTLYIVTDYMGGFGVFAVMIFGVFFGNSFVKKSSQYKSLSPFIFKSLEILIFLLVGFVISLDFFPNMFLASLALFAAYVVLRFIIITISYRRHSLKNKVLLSLAPKGMVFAIMLVILASFSIIHKSLTQALSLVLIFSLLLSSLVEYLENRKIAYLDRVFEVLKRIRFGRKRDLPRYHNH